VNLLAERKIWRLVLRSAWMALSPAAIAGVSFISADIAIFAVRAKV
jgi:hypothetical protein